MNDMIIRAAQDPSCILAVTPDRGGSWWATLRPDAPRNFAENAKAFYDCQAVVQEALDPTHDYRFLIEAEIVKENQECSMFYAGSDKSPFGVYAYSDNTIRVYSNLLRPASDTSQKHVTLVAYSGDTRLQGRHTIEFRIEGDAMRIFLDGTEIEHPHTFARTGTATVGLPNCNSGYVYKIQIEDLTTGETIWQAPHDELYETNPWPSATLRNFSEEPEYWYAAKTWFDNAPSGKMIFDFEFEQLSIPTTNRTQIFSNNGRAPFGCEWIISSDDQFVFRIYFYGLYDTSTISDPYLQLIFNSSTVIGKHTVHAEAADGMFSVTMDETDVSDTRIGNRVNNSFARVHRTTADCTIQWLSIFVENYKKFSYPNEAERVRLLTKTNVRTDRGVFEAADDANLAGIATTLDFRGNTTSKTFIVRAFCPSHDPASEKLYIHPFFGQGAINQSASLYTFQFSLWEDRRSGRTTQLFPTISTGTDTPGANVTGAEIYLDQWHTYAMVIDYNGGNCYIRAFVDGVLLREKTVSGTPVWNTPAATTAQETTVGIRRDPNASYYAGSLTRITAALIFDRALTAAEIAALS